jgi:hypothetical protein
MKNLILKNLQGSKVLILFIVTSAVYVFMLMVTIPGVLAYSNGMKILDMMPSGFTPEYVMELLETLGEEGREFYLFRQIPMDMIYPLLFGITYCLLIGFFLKVLQKSNTKLIYLSLFPLVACFFDYCENIGIIMLLKNWPDFSEILAQTTNIFALIKSAASTITFSLLIIVVIIVTIRWLTKRGDTGKQAKP